MDGYSSAELLKRCRHFNHHLTSNDLTSCHNTSVLEHDCHSELADSNWICHSTIVEQRGRSAFQRYYRCQDDLVKIPPQDAINTSCEENSSQVTATGWTPFHVLTQRPSLSTLKDKCRNRSPPWVWTTSTVDITDGRKYAADSIRNRDALAVSDRPYDNDCSAAACVIEGALPNQPCILCQATTPGPIQIHDTY
eukprot:15095461-Ditylum_brightwellii.AAC.1